METTPKSYYTDKVWKVCWIGGGTKVRTGQKIKILDQADGPENALQFEPDGPFGDGHWKEVADLKYDNGSVVGIADLKDGTKTQIEITALSRPPGSQDASSAPDKAQTSPLAKSYIHCSISIYNPEGGPLEHVGEWDAEDTPDGLRNDAGRGAARTAGERHEGSLELSH